MKFDLFANAENQTHIFRDNSSDIFAISYSAGVDILNENIVFLKCFLHQSENLNVIAKSNTISLETYALDIKLIEDSKHS